MTPAVSRSDRWVQVGVVLFAIGLLGVLGAVIPFFFGYGNGPTWIATTGICGVVLGFGCALAGIVSAIWSPAPVDDPDDLDVLWGDPARLGGSVAGSDSGGAPASGATGAVAEPADRVDAAAPGAVDATRRPDGVAVQDPGPTPR
ncbi:MAG: hypothetical protein ACQSGP_03315 [Frankia sp.]